MCFPLWLTGRAIMGHHLKTAVSDYTEDAFLEDASVNGLSQIDVGLDVGEVPALTPIRSHLKALVGLLGGLVNLREDGLKDWIDVLATPDHLAFGCVFHFSAS